MTHKPSTSLALCAAQPLPEGDAPEWVHLLPSAGGTIFTRDGRGPFRVTDPAAIIAASLQADERDTKGLIIDENHAADHAAPLGLPSPARGHIVAMETRADGIWGKVIWGATGAALLAERAYRGISPAIIHTPDGTVRRIARASLVNYPNLRGLVALNSESDMDLTKLARALGLAETATLEEIIAAVEALTGAKGKPEEDVALQSELGTILGVDGNRDALIAATRLAVSGKDTLIALQAQVTAQAAELKGIRDAATRTAAEAFVDGEIARKRVGLNAANRDEFISLHMSQPETARKLIEGMPVAGETHTAQLPSAIKTGGEFLSLNAEQQGRVLHDKAKAFQTGQAGKGLTVTLIDAIQHVKKEMRL
ncbi:phage protease [Rhodobacter capsulatus]|uniref:phage protease n=1 Tax=Rhodobacter capsulatus TaxID=1061 RepID=UPI0003D30F07|nr:phage protease [Rhodobacter capsulatus]ETD85743.1 hypothetical protein U703_02175 [Rhodobacter capsulatus YW1]